MGKIGSKSVEYLNRIGYGKTPFCIDKLHKIMKYIKELTLPTQQTNLVSFQAGKRKYLGLQP